MLIQSIKAHNFRANKTRLKTQNSYTQNEQNANDLKLQSYPKNYYLAVSFGAKLSNSEIVERIGIENFPSIALAQIFKAQQDKPLYDVHKEYYADLLNCQTLEEAKQKYPEFKEVISAQDVDINSLGHNHILRKILKGEIEGTTLESLSLDFLKSRYARMKGPNNREFYFNISTLSVFRIFELLNIKNFNRNYDYILRASSPQHKEAARRQMKENWAQNYDEMCARSGEISRAAWAKDDGSRREKARETFMQIRNTPEFIAAHLAAVQSDEFRQKQSEAAKQSWADDEKRQKRIEAQQASWNADNGKRREQSRQIGLTVLAAEENREKLRAIAKTPEFRQKQREIMLERWASDDGTMRKQAQHAFALAKSPEALAKIKATTQTPEHRRKKSQMGRDFHQSEQGKKQDEALRLAWQRHPEITQMQSNIAKDFPMLHKIRKKLENGEELNEEEKRINQTYWKRCQEAMPGYLQIISDEYHKIMAEWNTQEEIKNS